MNENEMGADRPAPSGQSDSSGRPGTPFPRREGGRGLGLTSVLIALGLALATPGFGLIVAARFVPNSASSLVLVAGVAALGFGVLSFTAGVAAYVFGPVFAGRAAERFAGYGTILGSFYLAVLIANVIIGIYFAASSGLALVAGDDPPSRFGRGILTPSALIVSTLVQELAILFILYFRVVRPGAMTWRDLGLNDRRWLRRFGVGLVAGVAVIAANGVVAALLSLLGVQQTQSQLFGVLRQGSALQFVVMLVTAGALAAFVEESFFRGYVFGGLYRARGATQAYLASALLFAAAHLPFWQAMPSLFVAGLILAVVRHRSGSVVPAMVAHGMNNILSLAILYATMA